MYSRSERQPEITLSRCSLVRSVLSMVWGVECLESERRRSKAPESLKVMDSTWEGERVCAGCPAKDTSLVKSSFILLIRKEGPSLFVDACKSGE